LACFGSGWISGFCVVKVEAFVLAFVARKAVVGFKGAWNRAR
jgi:hypothetical protein